jgi:hypothetical protein
VKGVKLSGTKKREYLKEKINVIEMNGKIKNMRDLCTDTNGFKKAYQPRRNLVQNEILVTYSKISTIFGTD